MINLVAKEVGNKWLIAIGTTRVLAFDYGGAFILGARKS